VAIASFGEKNLDHLRVIIDVYRRMTFDVDIVVNSEAPKDLGAGVKVIVGFPASNPHSLPFAHRRVFAENLDRYDLFIYTEDDIGVTEQSIHAFLRLTADLESDEIAGHLRYEVAKDGSVHLPDVHGAFHWRPESARRRGGHTVAEFTNEHAGFYALTQSQLRRAIASGGYLLPPREGRYGMLETGATDPYTSCGFRKVLSISGLEEFLIHHMPNRYVGIMGIPLDAFKEQIATLTDIVNGRYRAATLCNVEPKVFQRYWSKCYDEKPGPDLLRTLPRDAATTLSVGSGWGATEIELMQRGSRVTALPLDSVIGASLARHNVEVVSGTLAECSARLSGRKFDLVLMSNLLHLLPDPLEVLRDYSTFVRSGGTLVVTGYNFEYLPHLVRRGLGMGGYADLREFAQSGISPVGVASVKRELRRAGLRVELLHWFDGFPLPKRLPYHRQWGRRLANRNWIVKARQLD
jgi:SAM-dependent methyltransferase